MYRFSLNHGSMDYHFLNTKEGFDLCDMLGPFNKGWKHKFLVVRGAWMSEALADISLIALLGCLVHFSTSPSILIYSFYF